LWIFRGLAGVGVWNLLPDALAGLMLAAIAIPEQMATARLGDFPPEAGFVAFVAATLAFVVFGASRYLSVGADSTITPIFAAGLALVAQPGSQAYLTLAVSLALLVGALLIVAGLLRQGWIANLLSIPVTTGFLAGIAVHIAVSQLPTVLGIHPGQGDVVHQIASLLAGAKGANLFTLALATGVLAITLLAEHITPRIPGALLGLVLASVAAVALNLGARDVAMLGPLAPLTVPAKVSLPHLQDIIHLVPLAFILTMVIMVQSAATARSLPLSASSDSDFNRDLIGVGSANILAALAGAFPVNASPPRTAVAAESGARSQACGLMAAALVGSLAFFGSGLLRHVPSAALAGVLLYVSYRITRVRTMLSVLSQSKGEFALIAATIMAIIVMPIEIGVGLGIFFSLLHGMWAATRTRLIELENVPDTTVWWPPDESISGKILGGVRVVAFQAPLSFLNAEVFRADFAAMMAEGSTKLVVLEASSIVEIDFTAAQVLKDAIQKCHDRGITFALARLESVRARRALVQFGVMDVLNAQNLFRSVDDAIRARAPERISPQ
jgi:MFS superfamily sulfate permease-like transporter